MKIASLADIKAHFSAFVKASQDGPVVVTRNGKPVAVLVALTNEDDLERLVLANSPRLRAMLDAAEKRIQAGQGISHDDFWREFVKKPKNRRIRRSVNSHTQTRSP